MDPMQIRLNEVLYRERLAVAEQARRRRATWTSAPGPIDRLWPAIGRLLGALGRQMHARLIAGKVNS